MKTPGIFFFLLLVLLTSSCKPKKTEDNKGNSTAAIDATLQELNKKIQEDPGNYKNYLERAKYNREKGKFHDALVDIDLALQADSTKGEIYLYRGEIYFFQKQIDAAYKEYERCLKFEGDNNDCRLKKASIDIALRNYDVALNEINNALRKDEQLPYAYYLKGRLYRDLHDTTLAASSYQTAIELNPDYYEAYVEVALLYADQKSDLALEYYNTAIGIRPKSVEALYNKGIYLQQTASKENNRTAQAIEVYDQIEKIDPQNATANFNKGYIYLEMLGDYENAVTEFSKAIEKFPGYFQAYYNRGLANESLNLKKQAENDYRAALKLKPDYTDAARALSRVLGE